MDTPRPHRKHLDRSVVEPEGLPMYRVLCRHAPGPSHPRTLANAHTDPSAVDCPGCLTTLFMLFFRAWAAGWKQE